ncbi:MAG TPA: cohesin domain-containing protein [Bacteroidales bacterium]|nr:cohesin domain-containing protein [Bacteroidales bacterium]HRZ77459.1 cohesin domain-containing protein [Bacteroidales bacterium]
MKRPIRTLAVVCISLISSALFAQSIQTTVPDTVINEGDTVVVAVEVSNFNAVSSISLVLGYNTSVLTYLGHQNAHPSLASGIFIPGGIPPLFKLAWFAITPITIGSGTLIELQFLAHNAGYSALTWDTLTSGNCQYSDAIGDIYPAHFTSGSITAESLAQGVKARLFLQSAWNGSGMGTNLNTGGYLPLAQPYNVSPWNYAGAETLASIPSGMVDWVLVELRDIVDGATVVERRAALLMSDGSILHTDLTNEIPFDSAGSYYVVIDHRNHMPVMSANPKPIPDTTLVDFSNPANLYGGTASAINLAGGIYGMIAGDLNKDRVIRYSGPNNDRVLILSRIAAQTGSSVITTMVNGYFKEDVSMNGQIRYSGPQNDPSRISGNLITLTGSNIISVTYTSPVPAAIAK